LPEQPRRLCPVIPGPPSDLTGRQAGGPNALEFVEKESLEALLVNAQIEGPVAGETEVLVRDRSEDVAAAASLTLCLKQSTITKSVEDPTGFAEGALTECGCVLRADLASPADAREEQEFEDREGRAS